MRVGVNGRFLSAPVTGVQRFAAEVTRRLAERVDVALLLPRDGPSGDGFGARARVRGRLPGAAWEQIELPWTARRASADVVLHPANAAPRHRGPHVQVLHDLSPLTRPRDFSLAYRAWAAWAHLGPARRNTLVTVSRHSARQIARLTGRPERAITVLVQGVGDAWGPVARESIGDVRARFGLPERFFLALGGGGPRKGLAFLTRVFERASTGGGASAAIPLVVVGRPQRHVHASTAVGPGARHLGRVTDEELRALYAGALGFLFPSEEEGFGRPPLEALACGTRVVVAPYPASSEVLAPGIVRFADSEADWLTALDELCAESESVRAQAVAAGRAWAARFTWEEAIAGLLDVCRSAASTPRTTGAVAR